MMIINICTLRSFISRVLCFESSNLNGNKSPAIVVFWTEGGGGAEAAANLQRPRIIYYISSSTFRYDGKEYNLWAQVIIQSLDLGGHDLIRCCCCLLVKICSSFVCWILLTMIQVVANWRRQQGLSMYSHHSS